MSRKRKPAKPEVQASPEAERIVREADLVAEHVLSLLDLLIRHKTVSTGGVVLGLTQVLRTVIGTQTDSLDRTATQAVLLEALTMDEPATEKGAVS